MYLDQLSAVKYFLNRITLASTVMVLASCAAGPSFQEYSGQLSQLPNDESRFYIYRPASGGSSVKPDIKIDGKVIGQSVPKGFLVLDVKPGSHQLTTSANTKRVFFFYAKVR